MFIKLWRELKTFTHISNSAAYSNNFIKLIPAAPLRYPNYLKPLPVQPSAFIYKILESLKLNVNL